MKRGWLIGMMCLVGVLGVCEGCTGLGGETPLAEPSVVVATATATVTATPWPPTATVAPTVTPTAPPRWGAMWEEFACEMKVWNWPETIEGEGDARESWRGMQGERLAPIPIGGGRWIPQIYDQGQWEHPVMRIRDVPPEEHVYYELEPTRGGGYSEDVNLVRDKRNQRWTSRNYRVYVYEWDTKRIRCLRWKEALGWKGGCRIMHLYVGEGGGLFWDALGGRMYGLRGDDLGVEWEQPYQTAYGREEGVKVEQDILLWTGERWSLFVIQGKAWTVEGYEVRTGRHWYIRLAPQPGPWGAGWELKDVKYTWDQGKMALLQVKEGWPTQYRVLVYDLGACEEAGEAPCRPQAYDLAQIQKNWSAVCRHVAKMFWDPDGERLYLVSASSVEPGCDWQKAPSAIWELRVGEGEWHPIRLELTERALEEVRRLSGRDELGYSYLGPVAWDVGGGKRLLLHIVLPGYGSMYGWLKVEGEEEGALDLMEREEVPFGLVLPER